MTTTVWQGTILSAEVTDEAGNPVDNLQVVFGTRSGSGHPEDVTVRNYLALSPASGYCGLSGLGNGPVALEAKGDTGISGPTGTDFNSAWSDADSPPLLSLNPAQTYTLTITTDD